MLCSCPPGCCSITCNPKAHPGPRPSSEKTQHRPGEPTQLWGPRACPRRLHPVPAAAVPVACPPSPGQDFPPLHLPPRATHLICSKASDFPHFSFVMTTSPPDTYAQDPAVSRTAGSLLGHCSTRGSRSVKVTATFHLPVGLI